MGFSDLWKKSPITRAVIVDDDGDEVAIGASGPFEGLTNDQLRAAAVPVTVSDVATETTLAAVLAKIIAAPATAALQTSANALLTTINAAVTGILSVTPTRLGQTTRKPVWASGTYSATSGTGQKTGALSVTEVMITVSTDTWIAIGPQTTITVSKGAGSAFLAKGGPYTFQINSGDGVAFLMDSTAGAITVTPVT